MKIWIAWAFSTGKTTLAEELHKNLPNYLLDIDAERDLADMLDFDFNNHDDLEKAKYQTRLYVYSKNIVNVTDNIITDSPLQVHLWYTDDWVIYDLIYKNMSDLYDVLLYLPPEIEIENDWIRNIDKEYQKKVDEKIKEACCVTEIRNPNCIVKTIKGDINERLIQSLEIIKDLNNVNK